MSFEFLVQGMNLTDDGFPRFANEDESARPYDVTSSRVTRKSTNPVVNKCISSITKSILELQRISAV